MTHEQGSAGGDIAGLEKDIGEFFDRCSEEGLMTSFPPEEEAKLQECFDRWDVRSGERVLEPGCGSGRLTERLARAVGARGMVFGCDLSSGMIDLARARQLPEQAMVMVCSINSVPFNDVFFDKIICLHAFPHFSDFRLSLAEMARVLKPEGDLWIEHFKGRDHINDFHRNSSPVIAGHLIPDEWRMRNLLKRSGFQVAHFSDAEGGYCVRAVRDAGGTVDGSRAEDTT